MDGARTATAMIPFAVRRRVQERDPDLPQRGNDFFRLLPLLSTRKPVLCFASKFRPEANQWQDVGISKPFRVTGPNLLGP